MRFYLSSIFLSDVTVDENWFNAFREFIEGIKNFFTGLKEIVHVFFPFFTSTEINFVITFFIVFLGLLVYLLGRKVTI